MLVAEDTIQKAMLVAGRILMHWHRVEEQGPSRRESCLYCKARRPYESGSLAAVSFEHAPDCPTHTAKDVLAEFRKLIPASHLALEGDGKP